VAALLLAASDALQARLGAVTVRGELSGFTRASSGHCYFNLKDSDGQAAMLRCAMFRRAAGLLEFRPADGHQVELRGRIAVYEARGELQCVVESMQPLGAGTLYERFLELKSRLEAAGLFASDRKRELPSHPDTIGIVTSLQAAALHDVLTAIVRRAPHVRVIVYPSAVQGADAPSQLVQAIHTANSRAEVDALIVCRGGGSLEDLWAFNDEQVVRAIAASGIPVVCGVGHETDFTLAELAADLRAPTPTAAAELATPVTADEIQRLGQLSDRTSSALQRRLDQLSQRLDVIAMQFSRPARWLAPQLLRLQNLQRRSDVVVVRQFGARQAATERMEHRLLAAGRSRLVAQAQRLDALGNRLQALDPQRVLSRGYTWISDADGRPVTSGAGLHPGQRLEARWSDARAGIEVMDVRPLGTED
jgi:exodeoxyribonuclease VII large subunit